MVRTANVGLGLLLALGAAGCNRHDAAASPDPAPASAPAPVSASAPAPAPAAPRSARHEAFGRLTIDQVAARLGKPGVYLFDNNSRADYREGHVPTATWVAYNQVSARDLPADKDATLIFYCHNEH